jgi:cell division protein FtsL
MKDINLPEKEDISQTEKLIWLVVLTINLLLYILLWVDNLQIKRTAENLQIKVDILNKANNEKDQQINWLKWTLKSICKTPPIIMTKTYKEAKLKIK